MPDTDYDDSFWEDVDALRAMLDAEDQQAEAPEIFAEPQQAETQNSQYQSARQSFDLNLNFNQQPSQNDRWNPPGAQNPEASFASASHQPVGRTKRHRRTGPGLLVALYIIIAAELAALGGIGYHWYLWLQ